MQRDSPGAAVLLGICLASCGTPQSRLADLRDRQLLVDFDSAVSGNGGTEAVTLTVEVQADGPESGCITLSSD